MTHVIAKNSEIHLCTLCLKDFACCEGNVEFGGGIGDDNVIECDEFNGEFDEVIMKRFERNGEHSAH